jgi:hypothetical protein
MADRVWIGIGGADADASIGKAAEKTTARIDVGLSVAYRVSGFYALKSELDGVEYAFTDMPGAGHVYEEGSPMLIREGLFAAIPSGYKYDSHTATVAETREIDGSYNIPPAPKDVPEGQTLVFEPNPAIYGSDGMFPDAPVKYLGTEEIGGVVCAHLSVCPFGYWPRSKKLVAFGHIDIVINYSKSDGAVDAPESENRTVNAVYASQILGADPAADGAGKPRMIIVTTDELASSLRVLERAKTYLYDVGIVTLETLRRKYPALDAVEAIRTYLKEEHAKSPLAHVILGGNVDKIPSKMINGTTGIAANDNYYCSRDDRKSPLPLFALGRFPVSTVPLMNGVVDFASRYNRFYGDSRKKAVFVSYNDPSRSYEQRKRDIKATLLGDFDVIECYDGSSSKAQLISALYGGVGFVNYCGHGDYDRWMSSNGLDTRDVSRLNVGRNTPNVFSIACNNNGIHKPDCFGTAWLSNNKAITFLSASAPSYTLTNHSFDKYLWEAVHTQKLTKAGDIFVWATFELYRNSPSPTTVNNILIYLLLGDPSADYADNQAIVVST